MAGLFSRLHFTLWLKLSKVEAKCFFKIYQAGAGARPGIFWFSIISSHKQRHRPLGCTTPTRSRMFVSYTYCSPTGCSSQRGCLRSGSPWPAATWSSVARLSSSQTESDVTRQKSVPSESSGTPPGSLRCHYEVFSEGVWFSLLP